MLDVARHDTSRILQRKRSFRTQALALERFVPAFDLAVRLRIIGRGLHVSHAAEADELLEVASDKLRAVVGDDPRRDTDVRFTSPLQDGFDFALLHGFADLPVNDETTGAVEDTAQEIESAGDVEVADIDMPVLVRFERLHEAAALLRRRAGARSQDAGLLENAVNAGRAASDEVTIQEHEGESAIAFERKLGMEVEDRFFLLGQEPVVAWHPGIVFVDLAIAFLPVMEFALSDVDPGEKAFGRDLRLVGPGPDEVDDLVTCVVGSPGAGQASPRSFFNWACSSMSSAMTSFLRCNLVSRN